MTQDLVLHPGKFGLGKVPARLKPDDTTTSVCGFCSTGCGLNIHLRDGHAINLTPATDYPVNLGMACPKGWEALTPLHSADRATTPLLRNAAGELEPVDWELALQTFTLRIKAIQDKHGPDSVAYISTGQIVTEEMAFLGCLAKFGMGVIHGDGNTRQCMATAATAYKQSFGFDAPPFTYEDFEESDTLIFVGSNLCVAHPIMWQRVLGNRHNPKIIVVDPRKTETAMAATHHYAPLPKSDLALFYGLAHILLRNGWIKRDYIDAHTNGFEDLAAHVQNYNPEMVSAATGLSIADLETFAAQIHQGRRVSFWWTMGVNQSHEGTRLAQSLINLALMTGNIGRLGTGANSITGQCNAMGSRIYSNNTNLIGGHDFANAAHRAKIAAALGIQVERIPTRNSWAYDEIIYGIRSGKIKALWVIATNTAHSWIHQNDACELLDQLDFLVVQDMYHNTETARRAHLCLPAAGWGEKEGTFINSERRIGLTKKVSRAPGQALADFHIFRLVAHYWGCAELFKNWTSPENVFQLMKKCSAGQPCDITGIESYRHLDENGGIQWPLPKYLNPNLNPSPSTDNLASGISRHRRLFEDGRYFHADGRAKFYFAETRPPGELPDAEFPFILLTGRGSAAQWHTNTRTGKSAVLRTLYPERVYCEINPADAVRLKIAEAATVEIKSRRGRVEARALLTPVVQPGQIFLPMHYASVNQLTFPEFDPYSRQPSYKSCAVSVRSFGT